MLALLALLAGGCATAPTDVSDGHAALHATVTRLTSDLGGRHVHVSVSDATAPAAYSWPDGRVVVTRGLLRLLDEHELAAALAHELGHLVAGGHVRPPAALGGTSAAPDVESRADAAGCDLLRSAGYDPAAMRRMLQKVAASPGTGKSCRARLLQRIGRLPAR